MFAIECGRPPAQNEGRKLFSVWRGSAWPGNAAADPLLRLDNQICFAVYSAAHAFNRVYKPLLDRLGLTYPQYLVMLSLWERDGVPVKDIGERLFLDSGTLTPLLKRLEAAGLVKRTRSTEDERQVLIALTAQGQALKEKARAVPQSILEATDCSVAELVALKSEIVSLRDRLNAALRGRGSRGASWRRRGRSATSGISRKRRLAASLLKAM